MIHLVHHILQHGFLGVHLFQQEFHLREKIGRPGEFSSTHRLVLIRSGFLDRETTQFLRGLLLLLLL